MYYDDDVRGSQSLDAEAPPPPRQQGSYSNLYDSAQELPLGGSAHSLQARPAVVPPPGWAMGARPAQYTRPSPGIAKKNQNQADGGSNGISPTNPLGIPLRHPGMPSNSVNKPRGAIAHSPSLDRVLASDAKYPTNQALITDTLGPSPPPRPTTTTHKSSSTGQLSSKQTSGRGPLPQSRTSPVTISSQQGPPVSYYPPQEVITPLYNYPGDAATRLYNKGPAAYNANVPRKYKESGYSSSTSAARSSASSGDPLGAVGNVPGAVRRPMSFVRALEMSDQIQAVERDTETRSHGGSHQGVRGVGKRTQSLDLAEEDLAGSRQYGSSYEISV